MADHPGLSSVRESHMHCIPVGVHGGDVTYNKKRIEIDVYELELANPQRVDNGKSQDVHGRNSPS